MHVGKHMAQKDGKSKHMEQKEGLSTFIFINIYSVYIKSGNT
jgi:hypothetical protein